MFGGWILKSSSLLFLIFVLGILSKNRMICVSTGVLILFCFLQILPASASAQNVILDVGVILLVMGVLMSLLTGGSTAGDVYRSIFTFDGLVSFIVGMASAVMARGGVDLMRANPEIMIGLLFGSIVGTAFFRGIPTGPLVAAGLAAVIINILKKIQ
jgi:uncharacterized membrane protein (DUF441 family)